MAKEKKTKKKTGKIKPLSVVKKNAKKGKLDKKAAAALKAARKEAKKKAKAKEKILNEALEKAKASDLVKSFVLLLAKKNRLAALRSQSFLL